MNATSTEKVKYFYFKIKWYWRTNANTTAKCNLHFVIYLNYSKCNVEAFHSSLEFYICGWTSIVHEMTVTQLIRPAEKETNWTFSICISNTLLIANENLQIFFAEHFVIRREFYAIWIMRVFIVLTGNSPKTICKSSDLVWIWMVIEF